MTQEFKSQPARYAKNKIAVTPLDNHQGLKGRSSRLCETLNGKYSHREHAYIMSPAKVKKLKLLLSFGWDGNLFGDKFVSPNGEYFEKFPKHLLNIGFNKMKNKIDHPLSTKKGPTGEPSCPKCGNSLQNGKLTFHIIQYTINPNLRRCANCKIIFCIARKEK